MAKQAVGPVVRHLEKGVLGITAAAFLAFLLSPEGQGILAGHGFLPPVSGPIEAAH